MTIIQYGGLTHPPKMTKPQNIFVKKYMCTLHLHLQAILNYTMSAGLLPPLKHEESALFAVTAAALMWMYKKGPPQITVEVSNA